MPALFDRLNKLDDAGLRSVQALSAASIEPLTGPLDAVDEFLRRPRRYLAAYDLLMTAAMVRTCRQIETAPFELPGEASLAFRQSVMQAISDWQRSNATDRCAGQRAWLYPGQRHRR